MVYCCCDLPSLRYFDPVAPPPPHVTLPCHGRVRGAQDLVKVKTWWYVLLRAMREKLRGVTSMASARTRALRTTDRLRTLQVRVVCCWCNVE